MVPFGNGWLKMTDDNNVVNLPPPPISVSSGAGGGGDYGERLARLETRIEQTATKEDVEKLRTEVVKGVEKLRTEVAKGVEKLRTEVAKGEGTLRDEVVKGDRDIKIWMACCTASAMFVIILALLFGPNSGN